MSILSINPRDRFRLLLLLACFFLILIYQLSLKNTINVYHSYQQNRKAVESAENAPLLIKKYQTEIKKITEGIPQQIYNRKKVFELINLFCYNNDLSLMHFYPENREEQKEFYTITNKVDVQGSFINILKLCYYLEQEEQSGHLASCYFQIIKEKRKKKRKLNASLYLQYVQTRTSDEKK